MAYSRIVAAAVAFVLAAYSVLDGLQAYGRSPSLTSAIGVGLGGAVAAAALAAVVARWFTNAGLRYLMLLAVILNIGPVGGQTAWSAYERGRMAAIIAAVATGFFLMWKERRSTSL